MADSITRGTVTNPRELDAALEAELRATDLVDLVTPADPAERGAMLCLRRARMGPGMAAQLFRQLGLDLAGHLANDVGDQAGLADEPEQPRTKLALRRVRALDARTELAETDEQLRDELDTNLLGVLLCTRRASARSRACPC